MEASRAAKKDRRQLRPHELRKVARINLHAPTGGADAAPRCRLVLSYLVPAARWAPAYSLRVDPVGGASTLTMRAQVCQLSDEDWTGVQLVLSTADAMRWTELPELQTLRIGRAQPPAPSTGWRPPPHGADALYDDYRCAAQTLHQRPQPADEDIEILDEPEPAAMPAPTPSSTVGERLAHFEIRAEVEVEAEEMAPQREQRRKKARPKAKRARRSGARAATTAFQAMASGAAPPEPQATAQLAELDDMLDAPIGGAYGAGGAPPPAPPAGLEAGRDLLDYDGLRMAGPGEPHQGQLRRLGAHRRYRELLLEAERVRLPSKHELTTWVRQSARVVRSLEVPAGHSAPQRLDAFDHAWRGELPVDVPGDGNFHGVPVLSSDAAAKIRYVSVPRETQEVFRTLAMENPLAAPLLAGPVDVYMGADFLLTADLATVPARGQLELGLGVEEGIRVARNTRFSEKQRGMVSRHQDLEHELTIEVRNLLSRTATVEVRERIPTKREDDEDITVELGTIEPGWEEFEQRRAPLRGAHRWKLEIEPGEVRQLRASYVVTISPKHELVGGNRREA